MKSAQRIGSIWPLVAAMRCAVCAKTLVLLSQLASPKFNNLIVRKAVHFTRRSMQLDSIYIRLTD
jgi:hypothetical protein